MAHTLKSYLSEWIVRFIKNRDLTFNRIVDIKEQEEGVLVVEKQKQVMFIVDPDLSNFPKHFETLEKYDYCSLVVYNTKKNFDTLKKNWKKFSEFKRHFSIYFVNPFSTLEKRWVIFPHTHAMMTEKENLELSLKTLAEMVDFIDEDKLKKLVG